MNTVIVGVDGSPGSLEALRFAVREAGARGADVKAVQAWHVPAITYESGWAAGMIEPAQFERAAKAALEKALAEEDVKHPRVMVTPVVRNGQAAEVLCAEARGAQLLVVGSRGRGVVKGAILGSVSQQCVHHAPCPVAVVPAVSDRVA